MKAVKIVYIIMNVIMIAACIVLAIFGMLDGFNVLYLIAPAAVIGLFLILVIPREGEMLKKLMQVVLSSHIAVVIALTQGVFAFGLEIGNAIAVIIIAILLIGFLVWSLNRMFKKITQLQQTIGKEEE